MEQLYSLIEAIKSGNLHQVRSLLTAHPELAQARPEKGASPVLLAAFHQQHDILEVLLEKKEKLDIYEAAAVGNKKMLNRALNREPALINSFSAEGFPPLGLASYFNQREIVELLLAKEARVNIVAKNEIKATPLHEAVSAGLVEIARLLLEHGARVDARQGAGYTPLHQAAYNGQVEMVALLLEYKADVNAHLPNGKTPYNIAHDKGHLEVAELIRAAGHQ
jgi:ankyrin repeat protein